MDFPCRSGVTPPKNILRLPIPLSMHFTPALWTIYTFCLQGDLQLKQTDTQAPEELFFAL